MKSLRIIFFGTPSLAIPALQTLIQEGFNIIAVVTQSDKPAGRGLKLKPSPIKVKALELGLKVFTEAQPLELLNPDLGVAVAYGKIIPKSILDIFPRGVLNVHPSLLPKYRGPSPTQTAILNGDVETGVTIMLLDDKMDHGMILKNSKFQIPNSITGGELLRELMDIGAKLLVDTLPKYLSGEIVSQEQDHNKSTYTKILTREDGRIDWNKSAEYTELMVRAYDPWPGTWTIWHEHNLKTLSVDQKNTPCCASKTLRLKILKTSILNSKISCAENPTPGYIWQTKNGQLAITCNPGSLLLEQLQLEGKKSMTDKEFLQGHPKFLGNILV